MKNLKFTLLKRIIFLIATGILFGEITQAQVINLNNTMRSTTNATVPAEFMKEAKTARVFSINPALQSKQSIKIGDKVALQLFENQNYAATITNVTTDVNGTLALTLKLPEYPMGFAIITTTKEGKSLVNISIPELRQSFGSLYNAQKNEYYLIHVDENKRHPAPLDNDAVIVPKAIKAKSITQQLRNAQATDCGPAAYDNPDAPATISVLVVYTPAAAADEYCSTHGGIDGVIGSMIALGNLCLSNSNTGITLVLAKSSEVSYEENNVMLTSLYRLMDTSDGYMDEVFAMRKQSGADLVQLLSTDDDSGGYGNTLQSTEGYYDCCFSVCGVTTVADTYPCSVHEMGHNMGLGHGAQQTKVTADGVFPYSHGWRYTGNILNWFGNDQYVTVMSYSGDYYADGISPYYTSYFSNPDVYNLGAPTGDADVANAARSLREMKHVIAYYSDIISNTALTDLTLNGVQITGFDPNTYNYTLTVDYANVTIQGTTNECATLYGNTTNAPLNYGPNTFTISVYFKGNEEDYTITLNRVVPACSSYPSLPDFGNNITATVGDDALNLNMTQTVPSVQSNSWNISPDQTYGPIIMRDDAGSNNCYNPAGSTYHGQLQKFKVTEAGNYKFTINSGFLTLFNSETTDCSSFITSSAYHDVTSTYPTMAYMPASVTTSLNANTIYYLTTTSYQTPASTWNVSISGPGNGIVVSDIAPGMRYTYVAVSQSDNKIKLQSATADFRALPPGVYTVYGVPYSTTGTTDPVNFVGKTLAEIEASDCIIPSTTSVILTVTSADYLWMPGTTGSTNWTLASNWDKNVVPSETSNVFIPKSASYPILKSTDNAKANSIHFAPGAELGHQELLTYNKAFVQLDFSNANSRNRWWMLSNPLQQLFAGDFSFGGFPAMDIMQFLPNQSGKGTWQRPAEGMNKEFGPGDEFEIWLSSAENPAKGLKVSNGIITLPYFEDPAQNAVHWTHIYGTPEAGHSYFYGQKDPATTPVPKGVVRNPDAAYKLAGATVQKNLIFGTGTDGLYSYAATGNPFMSSIDFEKLLTDNDPAFSDNYWIWVGAGAVSGGSYATYNQVTGTIGPLVASLSQYIAPMQSFIVEVQNAVIPASANTFTYNLESIETTGKSASGLRSATQSNDLLEIIASTPQSAVRAAIASRTDGSPVFNRKDAHKLFAGINALPDVYLLKPDANNNAVAVGADILNEIKEAVVIPLGISTTYEGLITLSFTGMDTYNSHIFLIDNAAPNTKEIELTGKAKYEYTFDYQPEKVNGTAVSNESRFSIRLSPANVTGIESVTANNILVYSRSAGTIQAVSGELIQQMSVFDIQGRIINDNTSVNSYEYAVTNLVTGVYIVKVVTKNEVKTVKVIVR